MLERHTIKVVSYREQQKSQKKTQEKIEGKSQSEREAAQLSSTIMVEWYDGNLTNTLSFQGACQRDGLTSYSWWEALLARPLESTKWYPE